MCTEQKTQLTRALKKKWVGSCWWCPIALLTPRRTATVSVPCHRPRAGFQHHACEGGCKTAVTPENITTLFKTREKEGKGQWQRWTLLSGEQKAFPAHSLADIGWGLTDHTVSPTHLHRHLLGEEGRSSTISQCLHLSPFPAHSTWDSVSKKEEFQKRQPLPQDPKASEHLSLQALSYNPIPTHLPAHKIIVFNEDTLWALAHATLQPISF